MVCSGEDCTLPDRFGKHVQTGDPEFDAQFEVKSEDPDKVKLILLTPDLRNALMGMKNIRIEMDRDDSKNPFTLSVLDYGDTINVDEMVSSIEMARLMLNVTLEVVFSRNAESGIA